MQQKPRAPYWLWLLLGSGILVWLGATVLPIVHCHYTGKETVAVVEDLTRRVEGGGPEGSSSQRHYYTLSFDGHVTEKLAGGRHKVGDQIPVIYSVGQPNRLVYGSRVDGAWRTITRSTNEVAVAIALLIAVFFLFCGVKAYASAKIDQSDGQEHS